MNLQAMTEAHHATPWAWTLAPRQASTLPAAAVPRWLRVDEGCVWLTVRDGDGPADDIWLRAGESVALPAGTTWIVEAWPQARVALLQAAPSRRAPVWRGVSWGLRLPLRFA